MNKYSRKDINNFTLIVVEDDDSSRAPSCTNSKIVKLGKDIEFSPTALDSYNYSGWKPLHHDLLVLSSALEYADRTKRRTPSRWHREFKIVIPVNDLPRWNEHDVRTSLSEALKKLTGDNWDFEFYRARENCIAHARQRHLCFGDKKEFAIAFSDGLDSKCVTGIYESNSSALKVRISNRGIKSGVKEPFDRIPFTVKARSNESSQRTRGFKFAVATAIAADVAGIQKIIVPESGQGALGPVLLPIHNVYADYRNHPSFFRKMERFIRVILGHTLIYEQPRLWSTKGETIKEYLKITGSPANSLNLTRSCWQTRWNIESSNIRSQCGLCAACLLRRMSMFSAGINEPDDAYMFSDLSNNDFEKSRISESNAISYRTMIQYGIVGARHLDHLSQLSSAKDVYLLPYAHAIARTQGSDKDLTFEQLRQLLIRHSQEWKEFVSSLGPETFIKNWIIGGRYV
jgi:hypothetical protein